MPKLFDINTLAIDSDLAENGKWVTFPGTTAMFCIRRHNSDCVEQLRTRLTMEHYDTLTGEDKELADKVAADIETQVMAGAVLADWKGIGSGGKELKYTPEVGAKYLADASFKDIRQFVERVSINRSNWAAKAEEQAVEDVKATAAS